MFYICVFFNKADLVFMHEAVNVDALFNKSSSHEFSFTRLKSDQQVENCHNQIIGFMRSWIRRTINGVHNLCHDPLYSDQLQNGTRNIANIFKSLEQLFEELFGCSIVTLLWGRFILRLSQNWIKKHIIVFFVNYTILRRLLLQIYWR